MSHAFAGRSAATDGTALEKGRVNLTKVKRYWTGRAPEWAAEEETEELEQKRQPAAPVIIRAVADPRLERLSLSETKPQPSVPDHRRIHKEADEPDIKEEFTEASALAHRAQLRSKLIEKRRDEPELLPEEDDEEETLSEDSDTEEEEEIVLTRPPMMKPIFVSSEERETIRERMKLEEEEEREWEAQKQKLMQRQQDTKEIVAQKIKEDEALQNKDDLPKEANDINTDEEEEDGEFEAWKERERNRIQRDKEEVLASEKYAQERERLKNMTEEERKIYDRLNPKVEVSLGSVSQGLWHHRSLKKLQRRNGNFCKSIGTKEHIIKRILTIFVQQQVHRFVC